MKRNSMGLVWIFLATVFMHCENTAVEIDPAKAVSGKVKILELKEDNKTKLLYALEYDKDAKINKLTVSDNGTVKIYNVVLDSAGRVSKVIHAPAKDTSRYIYDNQKLLVGIEGSKKELFEYEAGKFTYYVRSRQEAGTVVFEDIYLNTWKGNQLVNQIQTRPGNRSFRVSEGTLNIRPSAAALLVPILGNCIPAYTGQAVW